MMRNVCVLAVAATMVCLCAAGTMQLQFTYPSSVSVDQNGPLDLKAEVNYDTLNKNAPIVVVMHGYSPTTTFVDVRANAQRLRDAGFFAVSVAMRGRDGSDGVRDSGGVEIYDIYDAVEAVKTRYAQYVNPDHISITGYSGGGGNSMAALTKFPDYFRAGSSYFGMSDYGHQPTTGWYFLGAAASHRAQLVTDIGDPTSGNSLVLDRYAARNSSLASRNNPYSEIHLFVNHTETVCPCVNHDLYKNNAAAQASFAGEFNNITVHIGGYGQSVDFNNNGVNDANELQDWPHGFPTGNQQAAAEGWYLARLKAGQIPQPVLNSSDSLYVAGFVKTKPFSVWLGNGQNAAADLDYQLSPAEKHFALNVLTSDKTVTGKLTVDVRDMAGQTVYVSLNGSQINQFTAAETYVYDLLSDGDTLVLSQTSHQEPGLEGDVNADEMVDIQDFRQLAQEWGACPETSGPGDLSGDGYVDIEDLTIVAENWFRGKRIRLYSESLDNDPCWQTTGQWQFGQPQGQGGVLHGNPDPAQAHSGDSVYGVNLQGDYSLQVGGPYGLTTLPVDCRGYKQISLRFARWLNTDDPYYVDNRVEMSVDGLQWHLLWNHQDPDFITEDGWTIVEYDLGGLADDCTTVYVRWSYEILNIRVWAFSGWNIDDIELWGKKD